MSTDYGYAFSFDRETFRGRYPSRADAVEAAERALLAYPGPVESIWVGRTAIQRLPVENLAEMVLHEVAERQSDAGVEPISASTDARDELDARLAALLRAWADDHDLHATSGIEAVSEHPMQPVQHVSNKGDAGHEVGLIGNVG
ncbi:MAG: hypothetical protein AAF561_08075 [Planctomycetota bacterium]